MNEFGTGLTAKAPAAYLEVSPYAAFFNRYYLDCTQRLKTDPAHKRAVQDFRQSLREIADAPAVQSQDFRLKMLDDAIADAVAVPALTPHLQRFCRLLLTDECSEIRYAAATYLNPPQRRLQLVASRAPEPR